MDKVDVSMLVNLEDDMCLLVPFSNGHRGGANPYSLVIVLPDLEFSNQFCRSVMSF